MRQYVQCIEKCSKSRGTQTSWKSFAKNLAKYKASFTLCERSLGFLGVGLARSTNTPAVAWYFLGENFDAAMGRCADEKKKYEWNM
jgi:hypothetical protein